MRTFLPSIALALGVLVSATASAGSDPKDSESHFAPPRLELKASSSGDAEFLVAPGWLFARKDSPVDWIPRLEFTAKTSKGVASLLSVADGDLGDAGEWAAGASLTVRDMEIGDEGEGATLLQPVHQVAYEECSRMCRAGAQRTDDDKKFCEIRSKQVQAEFREWLKEQSSPLTSDRFCDTKREAVEHAEANHRAGTITDEELIQVKAEALDVCLKPCFDPTAAPEARGYCSATAFGDKPVEIDVASVGRQNMCSAGKTKFTEFFKANPWLVARYPRKQLNVGARFGDATVKYLGGESTALKLVSDHAFAWSSGATGSWLLGAGRRVMPVEGILTVSRTAEAQDKARWCVPSGTVVSDDAPNAPAEVCNETPLGAPDFPTKVRFGLYAGYFNEFANSWRISAGVDARLPLGRGTRSVSVVMPIWFNASKAGADYKGLFRVLPSVNWSKAPDKETEVTFTVSLEVLTQPTMFTERFDAI
ncbi:hypothetical protein HJC10_05455 [Corallococcus exiguus]|uniref:hypothetical protein n=1 Tax=Corallococcus TaxID=83461 RepID=UPI000EE82FFD|nr:MULTISPECIES: hypothetical protein [Corallococcus]NNB85682.1 hypothetical protein [Corallococcus exiguus]NNC02301.1 hypothetical protein [Corallococcus exiguus]RKI15746.1 hypothetical protein D7Y15_13130 [Corallococcus sp. AB030]